MHTPITLVTMIAWDSLAKIYSVPVNGSVLMDMSSHLILSIKKVYVTKKVQIIYSTTIPQRWPLTMLVYLCSVSLSRFKIKDLKKIFHFPFKLNKPNSEDNHIRF